tara:strand:+ start:182 stop:445 length:264 start_codon:yes stop_codon:yes gene_type:complete
MSKVKVYEGTFVKKNGEERFMKFTKIKDLPKDFYSSKVKGGGKKRKFAEKSELVWEIRENKSGFRVFNWNTIVGEVKETLVEESFFA